MDEDTTAMDVLGFSDEDFYHICITISQEET